MVRTDGEGKALALSGQGMQVDGKLANWPGAWKRDNIQFSPDNAINPQTIATAPNQPMHQW